MREYLISAVVYTICVLAGGLFIGLAVDNFKRKRYILFGVDVMSAILMVLNLIQWKLL